MRSWSCKENGNGGAQARCTHGEHLLNCKGNIYVSMVQRDIGNTKMVVIQ